MTPPPPTSTITTKVQVGVVPPAPKPLPTSISDLILPGEVKEYETNRQEVGTDSGNVVLLRAGSIRVDTNGNKITHWVPVSSDQRHMRNSRGEQWTPADKGDRWTEDSPYVRWDVGLDKVTDLLQAKVPERCPASSFTLRYKER